MADAKPQPFLRVHSSLLWALQPFADHNRAGTEERFSTGALFAEPAAGGGALLGCVGATTLAVLRDPRGTCPVPVLLDIPDAAFEAAAAPEPRIMSLDGEPIEQPMPDWLFPGDVSCRLDAIEIYPVAPPPAPSMGGRTLAAKPALFAQAAAAGADLWIGEDYALTPGRPADWRRPLRQAIRALDEPAATPLCFDPRLCGLFGRLTELFIRQGADGPAGVMYHRPTVVDGKPGPIIVTSAGNRDFVGLYMPLASQDYEAPSLNFLQTVTTHG